MQDRRADHVWGPYSRAQLTSSSSDNFADRSYGEGGLATTRVVKKSCLSADLSTKTHRLREDESRIWLPNLFIHIFNLRRLPTAQDVRTKLHVDSGMIVPSAIQTGKDMVKRIQGAFESFVLSRSCWGVSSR